MAKRTNADATIDAEVASIETTEDNIVKEAEAREPDSAPEVIAPEVEPEPAVVEPEPAVEPEAKPDPEPIVTPKSKDVPSIELNTIKDSGVYETDPTESNAPEAISPTVLFDVPKADTGRLDAGMPVCINGLTKPYKTDADPIGAQAISGDVIVVDGDISRGRIRVSTPNGVIQWVDICDLELVK